MTLARFFAICFAFLSLLLASTGYWLYRGYPANLEQVLGDALAPYGIVDVNLGALAVGTTRLQLQGLALVGTASEHHLTVDIEGLTVGYDWRALLNKRIDSIAVDKLKVTLTAADTPSSDTAASLALNDYLPSKMLSNVSLSSIEVQQWEVAGIFSATGTAHYNQGELSISADTQQYGQQLHADLRSSNTQPLALAATISAQDIQAAALNASLDITPMNDWEWDVSGTLHMAPILGLLNNSEITNQLPDLPTLPEGLEVKGASHFAGRIQHPPHWPLVDSRLPPSALPITGELNAKHVIETLELPNLFTLDRTETETQWLATADGLAMNLSPVTASFAVDTAALGIANDAQRWLQWQDSTPLEVTLAETTTGTYDATNDTFQLALTGVQFDLGNSSSRLKFSVKKLDTQLEAGESIAINLDARGTQQTRLRRQSWPELSYRARATGPLTDNRLELALKDAAESFSIDITGAGDVTTGAAEWALGIDTADLAYAASSLTSPLKAYGLLKQEVGITGGTLQLTTAISTSSFTVQGASQRSQLRTNGVTGQYGEYAFVNLDTDVSWQGVERWQTRRPATIALESVNVGFPIADLALSLSLPEPTPPASPTVTVNTFYSRVFGGEVYLPEPVTWRVGAASNHVTVNASNWELKQLVALQQGQDIDARGILEGQLPLIVEDGRIIIEQGFLRAIPPGGSIRYAANDSAAALAQSNEELGLALELLEDFRFNVLSTDVALDKAGNLALGLALSGSNPRQFDGRQVNFNINLDQNIDPLLQSLRLSDTLVQELESRLR